MRLKIKAEAAGMPVDQWCKLVKVESEHSILVRLQGPPEKPLREVEWNDIVGVSFDGLSLYFKPSSCTLGKPNQRYDHE